MASADFVLVPAYGRDYRFLDAVITDLNDGKDFKAQSPFRDSYCNIEDLKLFDSVQVRYSRGMRVAVVRIKNGRATK